MDATALAARVQELAVDLKTKETVKRISGQQLHISNNTELQNQVSDDFTKSGINMNECASNVCYGQDKEKFCPVPNEANNCMSGLAFKVKGYKSVLGEGQGKVHRDLAEVNEKKLGDVDSDNLASPIPFCMSDLLRYTMIVQPKDYVAKVKEVREKLKIQGYLVEELNKLKNYWQKVFPHQNRPGMHASLYQIHCSA